MPMLAMLAAGALATADGESLRVRVLDPSGAVVPRAEVALWCPGRPSSETRTDAAGEALLPAGNLAGCTLSVTADGFEPAVQTPIPAGLAVVNLELPRREEKLTVQTEGGAGVSRERSFSQVLTPEEIEALPDDPDEMEEDLRRRAGPGASLRVNGFSGGRLPPKSQIRQIRIQTNRFAAEYHEGGHPAIEILTKPGLGTWRTALGGGLRDGAWAARPALASRGEAQGAHRLSLTLDGPLRREKTSLSLQLQARGSADAVAVTALAAGAPAAIRTSQDKLDLQARLEHGWGRAQTARAEVQRNTFDREGLGAGGLALPERGYAEDRTEDLVRLANSGIAFGAWATDSRLQVRREGVEWKPEAAGPAIDVLGAFQAGGAPVQGDRTTWSVELAQDLARSFGRHSLRVGALYEADRVTSGERRNAEGTFTFGSLEDWRAGRPLLFTQRTADQAVAFGVQRIGLYVQDDWRPQEALALNAGLRYEAQSLVGGGLGFAPRVGLTWAARPGLTLRAGGGLFFDWLATDTIALVRAGDEAHAPEVSIPSPAWPQPSPALGASATASRPWTFATSLAQPRVTRVSAGFEQTLGPLGRLNASYTYERGTHRLRGHNLVSARGGRSFEVRSDARSEAHTLRADVMLGAPGRRAGAVVGYLHQDSRNEADGPLSLPADEGDLAAEWGPAPDDVRHRWFGFGHWKVVGRLRVSGQAFVQSGAPWSAITGRDDNGDTVANDRPDGSGRNTFRGGWTADAGLRVAWDFGFGGARTAGQGPQLVAVRLGGGEDVPPDVRAGPDDQRFGVQIYLTVANVLNHLNATRYGNVIGSALFGRPVDAAAARRVEAGARFRF
jgi:hypothetical protein